MATLTTYSGRIQSAGGFSCEVKTYTIASRFGRSDVADDVEVIVRKDGSLGWPVDARGNATGCYNVGDTFHFDVQEDAQRFALELAGHRDGARVHIMEW